MRLKAGLSQPPRRAACGRDGISGGGRAADGKIEIPKARRVNRENGDQYQRNLFDVTMEDDLNRFENKAATYLAQQGRLFLWYRNRARQDSYMQGWKPSRIYADFIPTLKADELGTDDAFHRVFVPAMRNKVVRFEVVDEDEWQDPLNRMFRGVGDGGKGVPPIHLFPTLGSEWRPAVASGWGWPEILQSIWPASSTTCHVGP